MGKRTFRRAEMDAILSIVFHTRAKAGMPQSAMKCLPALPLLALSAIGFGAPPEDVLAKRYRDYNSIILRSDTRAMNAWLSNNCAPKFKYISSQRNTYDRDNYLSTVMAQMTQTTKVIRSTMSVRSFKRSGSNIVATVAADFKGSLTLESGKRILTHQSVSYETWSPFGKDWKLTKIVQVNVDNQVEQEGD